MNKVGSPHKPTVHCRLVIVGNPVGLLPQTDFSQTESEKKIVRVNKVQQNQREILQRKTQNVDIYCFLSENVATSFSFISLLEHLDFKGSDVAAETHQRR
ncbi:hypothetical protein AMECASPLE_027883 [Ameca splendens]|uniref:Uncharacterized protein n=1 Tax=Ameca splendens TaxID=208324 RepID=A0ABV0YT07_9TELE